MTHVKVYDLKCDSDIYVSNQQTRNDSGICPTDLSKTKKDAFNWTCLIQICYACAA